MISRALIGGCLGILLAVPAAADDAVERVDAAEAALAAALERKVERSNALRAPTAPEPAPKARLAADSPATASASLLNRWALGAGGFALILVVAAFWVKKTQQARLIDGAGVGLSIQDSIWIGKGQRLLVVNAGGRRFLLGATSGGLETLAELGETPAETGSPEDEVMPRDERLELASPRSANFKDLVTEAMANGTATRRSKRELLEGLRSL